MSFLDPEISQVKHEKGVDGTAKTLPLLLEVGCEEIPARFLRPAERDLGEAVRTRLVEARLLAETGTEAVGDAPLQTYSTPRRLVVHVPALLAQQPDKVEELIGPPVKVAVDAAGRYTRAAESFAQKNGARVEDLGRTVTPKGEYLALRKTTPGRQASEVLTELLPAALLSLNFPKSMYWTAKSGPRFVRPIRWIVALLGEGKLAAVVPFEVFGVTCGDCTYGHRIVGAKPIRIADLKDYFNKLGLAHVEINGANRRDAVSKEAPATLDDASLKLVKDDELLEWIVNSTEWPRPLRGGFDERFLHLPREILITVMRGHQKYFAVEDAQGNLRPGFVTVLNRDPDDRGIIRRGHERVLTARFRDAEFFWNADQRISLAGRLPLLENVTFQARLGADGSYAHKIRRMKALAEYLCGQLEELGKLSWDLRSQILRATELCKCDLTTQMVQEFPELQGVVGGLYAKSQGELEEVATAIYDHYLPTGAEGASPRTIGGALVSLVDKLDSVVAAFAVGHEPTGSSDPFGVRRQANGIVKVMVEFVLPVALWPLVEEGLTTLRKERDGHVDRLREFFRERLRFYLETVENCRYDTARAVIASEWKNPADAVMRARAIEKVRDTEDYAALAAAAKRTRNILRKSASPEEFKSGELDPGLLQEEAEVELYRAYTSVFQSSAEGRAIAQDYEAVLTATARLRPHIDRFFDKVLVMHTDARIRKNRLLLLRLLETQVFSNVADLSEIESNVGASTTGSSSS